MPFNSSRLSVNVGRLPSGIPGEFNSLRRETGIQRLSTAGTLPSSISGNFNNIVPAQDIPYGSIGFTLVCRAARDFSTILGIFYDFTSMSYTEELSGPGAGSVTFDLEERSFVNQLIDSNDPEIILAEDNLWEVYFDGERRFMWLGQNVSENLLSDNEETSVTIAGPGLAASLDWAKVLPNRFPDPKPKLATLQDDFVDQDLDIYGRWSNTVSGQGTISVSVSSVALTVNNEAGTGTYIATPYAYDFEESGASVRVQPATVSTGVGHIRTYMRIESSESAFVGMFVGLDGNNDYILVAEVNGPGGYSQFTIPYVVGDPMRYWRIQERDGKALFSYKGLNEGDDKWIQFAELTYSFVPTAVRLRLWVLGMAGAGVTYPQLSRYTEVSVNGVASPLPPFERFRRLILKAQGRGTINHILPDWSATADSMGAAWVDNASTDVSLGSGLLSVLDDYCTSNRSDWIFQPDFRLQIRQRVYVHGPGTPDPTAPFHKENKVIFYEDESQLSKSRTRSYGSVSNYLVGATSGGLYEVESDLASIDSYQQREELINDTLTPVDVPSLKLNLKNYLTTRKQGTSSWTVNVAQNIEGKKLYKDYELGDWISIQSANPSRLDAWRIASVTVQVSGEGDPEIELGLNAKRDPFWIKLEKKVEKTKWINPPNRGVKN